MFDPSQPIFLLGIIVLLGSVGFYTLRFLQPLASRDYDVVVAIIGMIYGLTLMWEGWRLIPVLAIAQLFLVGVSVFFAAESFRLRVQLSDRARQSSGGGGRSSGPRRGPSGFTKTYRPDEYRNGRRVSSSSRGRMEEEGRRGRTLKPASRPRLANPDARRTSSRRSRPTGADDYEQERFDSRSPSSRDDFDREDDRPRRPSRGPRREGGPSNGREDRRDDRPEYSSRRPRRPRPTPPGRDTGYNARRGGRDYEEGNEDFDRYQRRSPIAAADDFAGEDEFSNEDFGRGEGRPEGDRPNRRPRRRPPQMPDDIDNEPISGTTRPLTDIDVEDFDSEYDDDFDNTY